MTIPDFSPFVFPPLGPFHLFGLTIGPLAIRWYALAYVAGILIGWRYVSGLLRKDALWGRAGRPMDTGDLDDLVLWLTLGVILGGRIGYVVFYGSAQNPPLWANPLNIFKIWEGGMAFHGGLIGVATAMALFAWRKRLSLYGLGDAVAPAAPIGLFLGRLANFVNGELWGRPTDLPWGVVFCNRNILATYGACPEHARHPSQLYEAGLEGLALFVALRLATHRFGLLERRGMVSGIFLLGYGLSRALLENVREPDSFMPEALRGGLTMGMVLSLPMIALGAWLIWRARAQNRSEAQ